MQTVNWQDCVINSSIGREEIPRFVRGEISLRSIRNMCPRGTVIRSEIYKLEKMGVRRAREAARKALARRDRV